MTNEMFTLQPRITSLGEHIVRVENSAYAEHFSETSIVQHLQHASLRLSTVVTNIRSENLRRS